MTMARAAGMSRHQVYQAVALASIPEQLFEELVERPGSPPSVTELAQIGRAGRQLAAGRTVAIPKVSPTVHLSEATLVLLDKLAGQLGKSRGETIAAALCALVENFKKGAK
jgi:hypothetical protein